MNDPSSSNTKWMVGMQVMVPSPITRHCLTIINYGKWSPRIVWLEFPNHLLSRSSLLLERQHIICGYFQLLTQLSTFSVNQTKGKYFAKHMVNLKMET